MLHKETVKNETFELIKTLMNENIFNNFFLVGGTNLALNIGHRKSIDIDLFTMDDFNSSIMEEYLHKKYNFITTFKVDNTLKGTINNIIIDCIAHKYPLVKPLVVKENIRMASLEDVSAMKLNAIVGNGTRLKDFCDIAELSKYITLDTMIKAYEDKYDVKHRIIILKALSYYEDINMNEPINYIDKTFSWNNTKSCLSKIIKEPNKLFIDNSFNKIHTKHIKYNYNIER